MGHKHKTKYVGALQIKTLSKGREFCALGHKNKLGIKTSATHSITILGHRADYLCTPCTKEWEKMWEDMIISDRLIWLCWRSTRLYAKMLGRGSGAIGDADGLRPSGRKLLQVRVLSPA